MFILNNRVTGIQMLTTNHTFQHCINRVRMTLFEPKSIQDLFGNSASIFLLQLFSCLKTIGKILYSPENIVYGKS